MLGSSARTGVISREDPASAGNPQIPYAVIHQILMEEDMVHRTKEAVSEIPCQVNCQNCLNTVVTWYM